MPNQLQTARKIKKTRAVLTVLDVSPIMHPSLQLIASFCVCVLFFL